MRALLVLLALAAIARAEYVVTADAASFAGLIKMNKIVFVDFYAPWCGHCKQLAPEFEKAAEILDGKATFIKLDATVDEDFSGAHDVHGYPTLMLYKDGAEDEPHEYHGPRTAKSLVDHVRKMSGPPVKEVKTEAEIEEFKKEHSFVVTAFLKNAESEDAKEYDNIARIHRDTYFFTAVYGEGELTKKYVTQVPAVVAFRSEDHTRERHEFEDGTLVDQDIEDFLMHSTFPYMDEVDGDNYGRYIERGLPTAWLFVDGDGDKAANEALVQSLLPLAKKHYRTLSFAWIRGKDLVPMVKDFGLSATKWPAFSIDDNEDNSFPFDEDKKIGGEDFEKYLESFVDGELKPYIRSQPLPEKTVEDGLTTLVALNFDEIVKDENKDVFIKFYSPGCENCKTMDEDFKALAKTFEGDENIVVAEMDGTANKVKKIYRSEEFPSLVLVPQNNEVFEYGGEHTAAAMEQFIRENALSINPELINDPNYGSMGGHIPDGVGAGEEFVDAGEDGEDYYDEEDDESEHEEQDEDAEDGEFAGYAEFEEPTGEEEVAEEN